MRLFTLILSMCTPCALNAAILISQPPMAGGGGRSSQLWQDPSGNGNNLDGDTVCWADFKLSQATAVNHIEWWGNGACELGFQIEFWRQDPGTIGYQPLSVCYYGYCGQGNPPVSPEAMFRVPLANITTSADPGGSIHYSLDLANPVSLAANDAANPRWFVGVVGLTAQAYYTWNWSTGVVGGNQRYNTFEFIRGGSLAGGDLFAGLADALALVLADATIVPEPATASLLLAAAGLLIIRKERRS